MTDTTITQAPIVRVLLPGAGRSTSYRLTSDSLVRFDFDLSEAEFKGVGNDLEITVEGGGKVVLLDYLLLADANTLPLFEMMDGQQVAGDVYLFAFDTDQPQSQDDLETAAGAGATGSGAGEYTDDAGMLFDGLTALGGQGDAYDPHTFPTADPIVEDIIDTEPQPVPPVAVDDSNTLVESGWNRGEGENGQYEGGEFVNSVTGNLLLNDFDDDNIDYPETSGAETELSILTIDFAGNDFTGTNPGAAEVSDTGTQVNGLYGTLTIFADGSYEYVLDENLADPLRQGEEAVERFDYTAIDPDGNVSNTATLSITITGSNDGPDAFDDLSAEVIEQGTVVAGVAAVSGNVLHNDSDIDNVGYEDLDPGYRDLAPTDPDGLIELGVTSIYSSGTYQYDSTPDGSGNLTVDGVYGTLTINEDGSYEYVLDQNAADPLNIGDNPVETFYYSMWDGDKFGYAALRIPVIGSNDAPVADVDANSFTEAVDEGSPADVSGNVLANDADVDNAHLELSVSSVLFSGEATPPVRVSDAYTADHVIEGEFGTLYLNDDGSYHYVEDKSATDPLNTDDDPVTDVFTYAVSDNQTGGPLTDSATLTITITGANDSPVATVDVNSFTEAIDDGLPADVSGNILSNDADIDNPGLELSVDSIVYSGSATPPVRVSDAYTADHVIEGEFGTLYLNDDGSYHYVEDKSATDPLNTDDAPVTDVFTYAVSDNQTGGPLTDSATLTITITGANDSPVATVDVNAFTEAIDDAAAGDVSGNILTNDTDIDNAHVELSVDSIVYSGSATPPVRVSDAYTADHVIEGEFGTLYLNDDGSYHYVEDKSATDPLNTDDDPVTDVFTYAVTDNQTGGPLTDSATLTITITPANDSPVATVDVNAFTEAIDDGLPSDVSGNILSNDADIDNPGLELSVDSIVYSGSATPPARVSDAYTADHVIEGEFGTLYLNDDGSYHYVEDKSATDPLNTDDAPVTDVFTYAVSDNQGGGSLSDSATLTITITGANDSPVATVDVNSFTEAIDDAPFHAVSGNVLDNDTDVDNVDLGDGGTPELTVSSILYSGDATPPVRVSDLYIADHVIEGEFGTLYLNDDGSYVYVEDKNATDPLNSDDGPVTDEFTYVASDNQTGGALTDTATLTITITGANDSPVATVDVNAFTEAVDDGLPADVSGNILTNDTDIDNDHGELSVSSILYSGSATPPVRVSDAYTADHVIEGEFGTLYLNDDGSYHYVEDKNATDPLNTDDAPVTDVFTYAVSDNQTGGPLTDTATLTITITGANDSPVATVDVNSFTEAIDDAAAGDVSGNILTNDTDIDNAHVELSVSSILYSGDGTPPARVSDAYTADHVIEGEFGTLYLNDDGSYHYVEDKSATDPLNIGDDPVTDEFTYVVSDNQTGGELTDTATLTVTINPANDSPIAVHDGSHEIFITHTVETVIDDWSGVSGSVIYGPGYTVTAESFDANNQPIQDVAFTTWGNDQHLGIHTNGSGDDQKVDDQGGQEQITFEFDEPQSSFSIEFIAQGNNHVNAYVYPIGGGSPTLYTNVGNSVFITPGFEFDTIVFIPDGAFGMESLTTVTGGEDLITGLAAGNVLANDFDIDNIDFDDAATAGDPSLMQLSVSDIDSANLPSSDPTSGSDIGGDYHMIDGEFGALKIYETGEWSYTPFEEVDGEGGWQNLDHSSTEVFEYTVADGLGGTDTAFIEISLNVNTNSVSSGADPLLGTAGNDVLFPADGDTVTSGAGHDTIVIDPLYLGGDSGTVNITDFSDSDRLALGNMEGATVEITSDNSDVSLVFSDIDGTDDITVNLLGVNPVNDAVHQTVEITTSDDLNALIQSIIDSGNDGTL
ncbi:VCBS domain-containing protein [Pseudodesulfovibrio indicus]|uniref:beta strand repeat-containing protein n=1 Tax=Pseudodesulfovibrio indicus TaxID=1716143 RepID=UPI00292D2593|nr:VCBS domain-containing protein [Pseudodesulfovibrio indicus]